MPGTPPATTPRPGGTTRQPSPITPCTTACVSEAASTTSRAKGGAPIAHEGGFGVKPTGSGRALPLVSDPVGVVLRRLVGGGDGGSLRMVVTGDHPGRGGP